MLLERIINKNEIAIDLGKVKTMSIVTCPSQYREACLIHHGRVDALLSLILCHNNSLRQPPNVVLCIQIGNRTSQVVNVMIA